MSSWAVIQGDCLETMKKLPENSVDSVVTDPPYGLAKPPPIEEVLSCWLKGEPWVATGKGFMGKEWDSSVPGPEYWRECYRVLKPGGHMCVFAGSRTVDLMGMALRLAGFEIRDSLQWLYGSGFPKSMDVSKAMDRAAGAEREVVGPNPHARPSDGQTFACMGAKGHAPNITAPATDAAKQWQGWGTALKPAHEPILLVRKPFKGTVAKNVQEHGTGGLNIDGCRVAAAPDDLAKLQASTAAVIAKGGTRGESWKNTSDLSGANPVPDAGRWPANVIMDEEAGAILDAQTGSCRSSGGGGRSTGERGGAGGIWGGVPVGHDGSEGQYHDSGGASRFFYCAKTSKKERNAGLGATKTVTKTRIVWLPEPPSVVVRKCSNCGETFEAWREDELCEICDPLAFEASRFREETYTETVEVFEELSGGEMTGREDGSAGTNSPRAGAGRTGGSRNTHPTVKPISLMRWLCRLVTPTGGLILDPFTGSGSTGCAAALEGFNFLGCELSEEYCEIARARIEHHEKS